MITSTVYSHTLHVYTALLTHPTVGVYSEGEQQQEVGRDCRLYACSVECQFVSEELRCLSTSNVAHLLGLGSMQYGKERGTSI